MPAGRIVVPEWMPALDSDGFPLPDAAITVFENLTTTLATIYADEALTTPLTNPVQANSSGQFPAMWQDDALLFTVSLSSANGLGNGRPSTYDNYRPSVDFETATVALAEAASAAAATSAAAAAADLAEIQEIAEDAPDAPSVVNKANRNGDNIGASAAAFRTNIGLGNSATRNVGTAAGTVAEGDTVILKAQNAADFPNKRQVIENLEFLRDSTTGAFSAPLYVKFAEKRSIFEFIDKSVVPFATIWNRTNTTALDSYFAAAHAALPAQGGELILPEGEYRVSSAIAWNKTGALTGESRDATVLATTSATADLLVNTGQLVDFANLGFRSTVTRSAGAFFKTSGNRVTLHRFYTTGALDAIHVTGGATVTIDDGRTFDGVANTGVALKVTGNPFDVTLRDIVSDNAGELFAGVYITEAGDVCLEDLQMINAGQALYLNPGAGQTIASLWANNSFFDNSARGLFIEAAGSVVRANFDQCWFSSSTAENIRMTTSGAGLVDGIDLNGCHIFDSDAEGINILSTAVENVRVIGGAIAGNAGAGFKASAGVGDFSIEGCRIGDGFGFTGNLRAFDIASGAGNNIQICGNDLRGNTNTPIMGATGTNVLIHDNVGYEFPWRTYTPTVTAGTGTITTLGTLDARYWQRDKTLFVTVSIPITTNGTAAQDIRFTLPNSLQAARTTAFAGEEVNATGLMLKGRVTANSNIAIVTQYDNLYPGANGRRLVLTGVFEVN